MSKQGKRKISVELPKSKDLSNRPSVFERLGTKKSSGKKSEYCRQWAQHGTCAYSKSCKFASTHTLISPSKQRATNKDDLKRIIKDDPKSRLHSTVVVRSGRSPDGDIDNWDQNDLEYADTDVLEKRRQQLQRELELQFKMESGKDMAKDKKKVVSSSSSSRSSSSSSASSSSSEGSSSSSSSCRDTKRKGKKNKLKRNSSSSSEGDVPSKKKLVKSDSGKRDKPEIKKSSIKKDERFSKKSEVAKKKSLTKTALGKKSLSPAKKSGGTPPITSKSLLSKTVSKQSKSPLKKERNRSNSPQSTRDREKDKDRAKEKDKDRESHRIRRSRSLKKARSRSPKKEVRRKESSERSRPVSPKKLVRKEGSTDRHKKRSVSKERDRRRSIEKKKEKHEEKERNDRKERVRERNKDVKRDDKRRGRERGLGGGRLDKGLEKPSKPMQRLLPRPEERLAALAAISNRSLDIDKNSSNSKDRPEGHPDRGVRKPEKFERDRSIKRDRMDSVDREQGDYDLGGARQYDQGLNERYDRMDDRYDDRPRDGERSPGYIQARDRHYDPGYDMPGPSRGYPDDDNRMYGDSLADSRGVDVGYDDRRREHRERSWEGRSGSIDRDHGYLHHKEWDNEDYRGSGDWGRERHWPESQMGEWGDKEQEMEGWRHRGHLGVNRNRMHDDYNRGARMDHGRNDGNKRRGPRNEQEPVKEIAAQAVTTAVTEEADIDEKPIPDDLSEISDDPDDILEREDMLDQNFDDDSQAEKPDREPIKSKPETADKENTQDTRSGCDDKESQDGKDDDDVANLDFEEISDGELEEEKTRTGLGDALGVDWASLVADVNRREQKPPTGGARDRWRPERVLARLGLSLNMAGKEKVQQILEKNAQIVEKESQGDSGGKLVTNGKHDEDEEKPKPVLPNVDELHPVAAIQVALEKRKQQRGVLFGTGCEVTRGLSARRDLVLRRYLCNLPATERTGQSRVTPQNSLFKAAQALLMQAPVTG
ncbi:uncharacterized protein DDB_G0284459-like isoform X1 [Leptidea sinapis]|uniref:uncharacterized protein DDB_G0284459-like isoform X1 n=1 Tax=Leptidea sinapis TaxID=189913 RepID=UPI0021C3B664|nr:uncharacterized protein DDB_G0284459-like isoform X1 [Leptidea sinapis]